jgi:hypothetical protein
VTDDRAHQSGPAQPDDVAAAARLSPAALKSAVRDLGPLALFLRRVGFLGLSARVFGCPGYAGLICRKISNPGSQNASAVRPSGVVTWCKARLAFPLGGSGERLLDQAAWPRYVEWRDLYSLLREAIAIPIYLLRPASAWSGPCPPPSEQQRPGS